MKSYNEILSDVTKTAIKIPQSDYLDAGKYRIFDQGKEYSVGFSNDEQGVVTDYPYIIFGDHTRVVKYVDEPCYIGADGVKLLKVINKDFDPRYVYYNILAKPIESQGYARHFKFLKEIQFTEKSFSEQQKIAAELDKIQSAIDNKKQQLSLLDEAVKSEFVEMFGENPVESGKWKVETLGKIAEIGSSKRIFASEYVTSGIPFYRSKEIIELSKNLKPSVELFISKERYEELKNKNGVPEMGDILMTAVGTIGKFWEVNTDKPFYYKDGNLVYIRCKIFNSTFFRYILESLIEAFKQQNLVGSAYSALTIDRLKQMTVPMIELDLQNQFAAFVQQIDKSKFVVKQQITDLQELLDSKMQEYFS